MAETFAFKVLRRIALVLRHIFYYGRLSKDDPFLEHAGNVEGAIGLLKEVIALLKVSYPDCKPRGEAVHGIEMTIPFVCKNKRRHLAQQSSKSDAFKRVRPWKKPKFG